MLVLVDPWHRESPDMRAGDCQGMSGKNKHCTPRSNQNGVPYRATMQRFIRFSLCNGSEQGDRCYGNQVGHSSR